MTNLLFTCATFALFATVLSSKLHFHNRDPENIETEDTAVKERRFLFPSDLFAPPPEGQIVDLGVEVRTTCNEVSIDITDTSNRFNGGQMEVWLYPTAEAPSANELPPTDSPNMIIDAREDSGQVSFDILFEELAPCSNYTVIAIAYNATRNLNENTVSHVDTDCPCDMAIVNGDPHYHTFDGVSFTYNGDCTYLLAEDCVNKTKTFQVFSKHGTPAGTTSRRVVKVEIVVNYDGEEHVLSINHENTVVVDKHNLQGADLYRDKYFIYRRCSKGAHLVFPRQSGLWVKYIPNVFKVIVGANPNSGLEGKTCGLLGNNNGKNTDDLLKPDGTTAADFNDLGDYFAVPGSCPV